MLSLLHQPFPAHTLTGSFRMAALIGLFVAVFLGVFQPFGLREMPDGTAKMLLLAGYGLITFACICVSATVLSRLFPKWFLAESWTIGKEIQITLFNFLLIGLVNTLYTYFIFDQPVSLPHLLRFEGITLAVGILPVSLIVLFRYSRLLRHNLKLAGEMNSELKPTPISDLPEVAVSQPPATSSTAAFQTFTFSSESGTEQLTLTSQDFLFAIAADNYVELHFLQNNQPKKSLIRNTLTKLEETVKLDPKVVRCHRAYLVNLTQVKHFSGNAQGLKLELHHTPELIPVSRKMVPEIKALLPG